MSKTTIFSCNLCAAKLERGKGLGIRWSDSPKLHINWDECGAHLCPQCVNIFESHKREESPRDALKFCHLVIEKGIEARIGDSWPAIKALLPDAIQKANAALAM